MTAPRVPAGTVVVELPCPRCGVLEAITVGLSAVLTMPSDDTPTLKVKAHSKALEHYCHPAGAPATLFTIHTGDDQADQ